MLPRDESCRVYKRAAERVTHGLALTSDGKKQQNEMLKKQKSRYEKFVKPPDFNFDKIPDKSTKIYGVPLANRIEILIQCEKCNLTFKNNDAKLCPKCAVKV